VGRVKCACCGHVWRPKKSYKKLCISVLIIILLFFIIYSLYSIISAAAPARIGPLTMRLDNAEISADGVWNASGTIINNSDTAYGVPNFRVKIADVETIVMSPIPVLGAGESGKFQINGQAKAIAPIEIEFVE